MQSVSAPAAEEILNAIAKLRALDDYFGSDEFELDHDTGKREYMERVTDWEIKFVGDVKDRIDRYYKQLTVPQYNTIIRLFEKVCNHYKDLDFDAFRTGDLKRPALGAR